MQELVLLTAALLSLAGTVHADYQPLAKQVVDNVYAIVGPLGQRSADNDGLNANFGFIVTDAGVILIDSGASKLGAEKLAAAVRSVTDKPVRWVINTGSQDHRWLGNDYFADQGAEVMAMAASATSPRRGERPETTTTSWSKPSARRRLRWNRWTPPSTATQTCRSSTTWRTTTACTGPT